MSATNHTANYELSQYIGSDEPKYLTDYNSDMSKIDTAIKTVETSATTANTGVATNASAIGALDTAVGSLQTQVATVAGVANGNTGSINTINSLIGNGEPTTQDKTIIGAINEIDARTGDADGIDFDNAGTGLTATNVQDAIEEVNAKIPQGGAVEADDVVYDNTSSGLTATNVQDAVDELNTKIEAIPSGTYDLNLNTNVTATVTAESGLTVDGNNTFINVLTNADKSVGKIYGSILVSGTLSMPTGTGFAKIATISASNLPTIADAYDIIIGASNVVFDSAANFAVTKLHFNTNGTVDVMINHKTAGGAFNEGRFSLAPCLLFLKDLGD